MTTKIQSSYTKSKKYKRLVCIGDSLTYNYTWGVVPDQYYTQQLANLLNAAGCNVTGYNNGVSGNTTGQMLFRVSLMTQNGTPDIAVVYGGVNDLQYASTVQASPTPTSTVFAVASGKGANYQPGTYLTVGGTSALILSVSTDTITLASALPGGAPSVGAAVAIDTQTNLTKIGQYLTAAGCTRIVYGGLHYYNYSSGGDTHASPLAANVTLRGLQSAAASAVGAQFCNFWNWMDNLIQTGQAVQGSYSWHVLDSNLHLNASGELILAQALYATISAQSGWLAALQ